MSKSNRHKKTPVLAGAGVWANEINFEEENVMTNNSTAVSNVIPFAFEAKSVRVQEVGGAPWFCVTDVCSILGYSNSRDTMSKHCREAGVAKRDISSGGQNRSLSFIDEGNLYRLIIKSRKEEAQRFESWVCDEVLPAIRKYGRYEDAQGKMATLVGQTIGTDGFHMLGAVVKGKVSGLPVPAQRRATAKIWSQTHAAFGVRSAADIPAEQLDSARNFIAAYVVIEGDYIQREPKSERLNIHFPIQALANRREGMLTDRGDGHAWLDVCLQDVGYPHGSLCELIIFELEKAGYVVDAARWELATYRNKLRGIDSFVRGMNRVVEDPHRYAVEVSGAA